ncbi:unnamed protein product [Leptidea sinapis]|uniref:Uncharacterized protein n=1 Tax=Leptidea sinapis TaxID=189913 RepID=A0A5E4QXP2_9NEOP|nr:unnamed protein product [Leptidea sinapis]
MAHVVDPSGWTNDDVDETLVRGDILYQNTMEHLEKMGISLEAVKNNEEEIEEEESGPSGTLAAADVLTRFRISEYDCIETEVMDSVLSGQLNPEPGSGVLSLKDSLRQLFKEYKHAVVTARGASTAIWKHDESFYFFDPHGCDESGFPSDEPRATACLVRLKGSTADLANLIMGNLPPGKDDSFNISPVLVTTSRLHPELGAPEMKPDDEDMAGRTIALPAAAAFAAASDSVPPPFMHQDHMYNFLEILPEDLTEKFEMGANTFSIELEDPIKLPLRLPDEPAGEGEEEGEEKEIGEGLEEEEKEEPMKQIKDALFKAWNDDTKPTSVYLLYGDYHQMGVWMRAGGKVVAFDPAPTLNKGMLTSQRIKKGWWLFSL